MVTKKKNVARRPKGRGRGNSPLPKMDCICGVKQSPRFRVEFVEAEVIRNYGVDGKETSVKPLAVTTQTILICRGCGEPIFNETAEAREGAEPFIGVDVAKGESETAIFITGEIQSDG